jgi:hypothetical protein
MHQITSVVVVYVSLFYAAKCIKPDMRTCSEVNIVRGQVMGLRSLPAGYQAFVMYLTAGA